MTTFSTNRPARQTRRMAVGSDAPAIATASDPSELDHVLGFAIRWMAYGGGPAEDILINFGTTPRTYFGRLNDLLSRSEDPVILDRVVTEALLSVCRRRLWLNE